MRPSVAAIIGCCITGSHARTLRRGAATVAATFFDPNRPETVDSPLLTFIDTWYCVRHGKIGDINGPVHYDACKDW